MNQDHGKPLTQLQFEVFEFIQGFIKEKGYGPKYKEIKENTSLENNGSVDSNLSSLSDKGYINRKSNTERGIELTEFGSEINLSDVPLKEESGDPDQLDLL